MCNQRVLFQNSLSAYLFLTNILRYIGMYQKYCIWLVFCKRYFFYLFLSIRRNVKGQSGTVSSLYFSNLRFICLLESNIFIDKLSPHNNDILQYLKVLIRQICLYRSLKIYQRAIKFIDPLK